MRPASGDAQLDRALCSLDGLSVGDAFGQSFFVPGARQLIADRVLPAPRWRWTDDTAMATSVVEVLRRHGGIDADDLARTFAERYREDPWRGYGGGAREVLRAIGGGTPWERAAAALFGGEGSMGNGGGMRAAPIGAYLADDLAAVVEHARRSAVVTHAHPEGQAGAIAVAVAAAAAVRGVDPLALAAEWTPAGATRDGLEHALAVPAGTSIEHAVEALGNGSQVLAHDTVPFALWCAARHLCDYAEALWATVSGLGDRDTTAAIAGGIVALASPIPSAWLASREPLDLELRSADDGG